MTTPGPGNETVVCPQCAERVGGDEPFCPFCGADLWELEFGDLDEPLDLDDTYAGL